MDQHPQWSRPQCAQDWENRKDVIVELYEFKTLKETMRIMENKHSFKATEKQYKKQLQKWDIDHKRIKPTEYKAMIRKKRQREEDGEKEYKFQLRGVEIDDAKIIRFQKRHRISEPEQVFDCPTPPGLICIIPAPIPPSPGLRPFPWYNMYERYLDLSMAGASTIQSNNVQSILRSLVVPFPNYEDEGRFLKYWVTGKSYGIVKRHLRRWNGESLLRAFAVVDLGLGCAMSAPTIQDKALEIYQTQKLLGFIISEILDRFESLTYGLSSLNVVEQVFVLWAVTTAVTIQRLSGRPGEAFSLLELGINLVEQHLDLKDAIIRFCYNEMLIELAHCCAEDGHRDEARHLLNKQLKWHPSSKRTIIAKTRLSLTFGMNYRDFFRHRLRRTKREGLQLVEELENDRVHTHSTQEHHERPQEGSCQPGTSEWGPFLSDCIEWDKI